MSAGGQCASEMFQLHGSIISSGVLLTLIMEWEEGTVLPHGSVVFRLKMVLLLLTKISDTAQSLSEVIRLVYH